ncbi:transcription termination factor Rho [Candidatus Gottesmanbacteria bacterium]|nr:transcription termination factor Rho [Candidatus Gottesmanbacteria bacterium]
MGAQPPVSVDDLVGGGKAEPTVEAPKPESRLYRPSRSYGPPSHGGGQRGRFNFRRSFGYRNGNGGGNGGYDRPPRREYSENGYEPDVNVPTETVRGVLDTMPEGHGFLRPKYTPSDRDIYISQSQIRRFLLRNGDMVEGQARPPKENERYWGLLKVEKIDELPAESMEKRPKFEDLVPVYPNVQLRLETEQLPLSTRMIDLIAPIGFGQRGLVVSPPKAGKTTILKELAAGIAANYPQVHLMAALIGERPEEVTDISRNVQGEVFASNFDESPSEQTRIAEVALDRAKRLVEMGRDVVILLDSITRLARAYNLVVNPSGRTLTGGFDPAALYPAKRFLGAARCVELAEENKSLGEKIERVTTGGSLTVIGTALVDTGSRMDDLIYEEFKGTGNMELTLSRVLQERRIFPAIDVGKSGTRHDELLLGEDVMKKVTTLRHMLSLLSDEERTMMLIERLGKTKTNTEFLESLAKG